MITAARGGTEEVPVDAARATAPCLDRTALLDLSMLASRCIGEFGPAPLDLEWAFAGGRLHLLQCRAATGPMINARH